MELLSCCPEGVLMGGLPRPRLELLSCCPEWVSVGGLLRPRLCELSSVLGWELGDLDHPPGGDGL